MPKITEMFAFVAADKDVDDEGVLGVLKPNGVWMPLVGADMKRVVALKPMADYISSITGKPYKILKFKLIGEI